MSLGTITHWMLSCRCGQENSEETQEIQVSLCRACGKRMGKGRDGSITQYVFFHDACACQNPVAYKSSISMRKEEFVKHYYQADFDDEEELQLDKNSFPCDRFKPIAELGRGASGTVWLARDRILQKRVAVKVLHPGYIGALSAFQDEARLTGSLKHQGIVEIVDIGLINSIAPYMVLEYIPGVSLQYILKRDGKLDWPFARSVAWQVLDALAYAHEHGIYHRDIQPGNILIVERADAEPVVKLIDFGIAAIRSHNDDAAGTLAGTPLYMSADVGSGRPYDDRSEVYSVGCVLFEALTGRPPYLADNALQILSLHANAEIPEIVENASVPDSAKSIVAQALAKNPQDRFQKALIMRDAVADAEGVNQVLGSADCSEPSEVGKRLPILRWSAMVLISVVILASLLSFLVPTKHNEQGRKAGRAIHVAKPSETFEGDDFLTLHERATGSASEVWTTKFMDGQIVFKGSTATRDKDFAILSNRKGITNIGLDGLNEHISGEGVKFLHGREVKALGLPSSALTDKGLTRVCELESLEALSLEYSSQLTSLKNIRRLKRLKIICLRYMNFPEDTLTVLTSCPSIVELTMAGCQKTFKNADLELLTLLPNLRDLSLIDDKVDSKQCLILANLKRLKSLSLKANQLNDESVETISRLPLLHLDLSDNRISDRSLRCLERLKTLVSLTVIDCEALSAAGKAEFRRLRRDCKLIELPEKSDISI